MKFRERVSVICLHNNQILGFRAVDPSSREHFFFLPGGGIEIGETQTQAALRETWEETGYRVRLTDHPSITARYHFRWDGKDFDCLTHFFRAELDQGWLPPGPVQDQAYNLGPQWRDLDNLEKDFAYHPQILATIQNLIKI